MVRFCKHWGKVNTGEKLGEYTWFTESFISIKFSRYKLSDTRCCVAKYDSVPHFLFIFLFVYISIGKCGYWD